MSEQQRFVIRRAFVLPLGLLIGLTLALLVVCLVQGQPIAKALILGFLMLPLLILFVESALRRIEIDALGVTAKRPFRQARIPFDEVTSLETVQVRSRVFLTLSAGDDDYLIISNSYAGFPAMLERLISALPEEAVTEETRRLAGAPKIRQADIVTAWFAVVALTYVLVAQFVK